MTRSLARLTAQLASATEEYPDHLVTLIEKNIDPPSPVTRSDIYIRAMYVVSDQVNSFGGCFDVTDHAQLAELMLDAPVMIGHRKDQLPLGRVFHAVVAERDGTPWVKAYFYWLRSSSGADELRDNIDGGVYKECSVAFTYLTPECSICGKDIRQCPHQPFQVYRSDGESRECHFVYRDLDRVLEISLVYRGAVPNTRVGKDLNHPLDLDDKAEAIALADFNITDTDNDLLVIPKYEGLPARLVCHGDAVNLLALDDSIISSSPLDSLSFELNSAQAPVDCQIVGYRGKQRLPETDTLDFLLNRTSCATHVVCYLIDPDLPPSCTAVDKTNQDKVSFRVMPSRKCTVAQLAATCCEIGTRDGTLVITGQGNEASTTWIKPQDNGANSPRYQLHTDRNASHAVLTLDDGETSRTLTFTDCDPRRMQLGLAYRVALTENRPVKSGKLTGQLLEFIATEDILRFRLGPPLTGEYVVRSVRRGDRREHLCMRLGEKRYE